MIDRRAFLKSMASLTTGILLSSACAEGGEEGTAVNPPADTEVWTHRRGCDDARCRRVAYWGDERSGSSENDRDRT